MMPRLRHKDTGEELELLDITIDHRAFVAPPGHPEAGRLVLREALEPDPWEAIFGQGYGRWMT